MYFSKVIYFPTYRFCTYFVKFITKVLWGFLILNGWNHWMDQTDSVHHKDIVVYCTYVLSNWVSYSNIELDVALIYYDNPFLKSIPLQHSHLKWFIDIFRLMSTMLDTLLNSFHLLFIFVLLSNFSGTPPDDFFLGVKIPAFLNQALTFIWETEQDYFNQHSNYINSTIKCYV